MWQMYVCSGLGLPQGYCQDQERRSGPHAIALVHAYLSACAKMLCDVTSRSQRAQPGSSRQDHSSQSPEQGWFRSASLLRGDLAGSATPHKQQKLFSPVCQSTQSLGVQLWPGGISTLCTACVAWMAGTEALMLPFTHSFGY